MNNQFTAKASITINVPVVKVWEALTDPEIIKQYFFGSEVDTDWEEGSPIYWRGMWNDKPYEDKGMIIECKPEQKLVCTHFSPLSGVPDKPENYHTLTYELSGDGTVTHLTLTQDNNANETEREHSQKTWETMFENLKKLLEK